MCSGVILIKFALVSIHDAISTKMVQIVVASNETH